MTKGLKQHEGAPVAAERKPLGAASAQTGSRSAGLDHVRRLGEPEARPALRAKAASPLISKPSGQDSPELSASQFAASEFAVPERAAPEFAAQKQALLEARNGDPFAYLGLHEEAGQWRIRVFAPGATQVEALARADCRLLARLRRIDVDGLFEAEVDGPTPYLLRITRQDATAFVDDPYAFGPVLDSADLKLFAAGEHPMLQDMLGAHVDAREGRSGVRFAVWAPNAQRVSVIGDFNDWDPRRHAMRHRLEAGVWEIFLPAVSAGARYKFSVLGADGVEREKADPFARKTETPPLTASIIVDALAHEWRDDDWMASRAERQSDHAPISIYECHAASWMRPGGRDVDWEFLSAALPLYVKELGFTHIELLPITEHPFGGSWGYQTTALFAPTARLGDVEGFARFVDACHAREIGVILDWAPGHFPDDAHGLVYFDGTALFEHLDPREGRHPDWNTLIYNYGRPEVRNFLIASALFWLEQLHIDGLRIDAVASMLYRDYSRGPGQWIANQFGGRENLEAVAFLQALNKAVRGRVAGAITIAEESTAWPGVTAPVRDGGLGFDFKWNMGWMNDTLRYFAHDPIYRKWRHDEITFSLMYAHAEKFVLAISHDEVVHGKGALIAKAPGDEWKKRAHLRLLFALMWTHPGKKLLFMGAELGQTREWSHDGQLDWKLLNAPEHASLLRCVRDLNALYRREAALWARDAQPEGFRWIVVDDRDNSVFVWMRQGDDGDAPLIVAMNFTPEPRSFYRIGAPYAGFWQEIFNSDSHRYGGSNIGNLGGMEARGGPSHGFAQSLELVLPPLGAVILRHEGLRTLD